MTQTAYTIDSANDTGHIDIFVDQFVSSFDYFGGNVTLLAITAIVDLTRDMLFYNVKKIEEWLELLVLNMEVVVHPQPEYSFEIEHSPGVVKFKFTHGADLVLQFVYDLSTKMGDISPRPGQVLTLRAFSRYVEALRMFLNNIDLYK